MPWVSDGSETDLFFVAELRVLPTFRTLVAHVDLVQLISLLRPVFPECNRLSCAVDLGRVKVESSLRFVVHSSKAVYAGKLDSAELRIDEALCSGYRLDLLSDSEPPVATLVPFGRKREEAQAHMVSVFPAVPMTRLRESSLWDWVELEPGGIELLYTGEFRL